MRTKPNKRLKTFVDGGFNKGQTYKKVAFELNAPDIYYAFEPDPRHLDEIKFHVQNYDICFFSSAMWITDNRMRFNQCNRNDEQAGSLNSSKWMENTITVPTTDIIRWTKAFIDPNNYNILKLDIESAEYAILKELIHEGNTLKSECGPGISMFQHYYDELWVEWHSAKHFRNHDMSYEEQNKEWETIIKETEKYCNKYFIKLKVLR